MADSYTELRRLRLEMGYSMRDMALLLKIPKATYQKYEDGSRRMPAGFINRVREWQQLDLEFFAGMTERIEEQLLKDGFGVGIPSERDKGDGDEVFLPFA